MTEKPTIVLQASIYDECEAAGLLSDAYIWVRQESPSPFEAGVESLAEALSKAEAKRRAAVLDVLKND